MKYAPLDWHLNTHYPEAEAMSYLGRIPLLVDPDSDEVIWLQVQTNYPAGWNPEPQGAWKLTADDYLIYNDGQRQLPPLAPAAMAFHHKEQLLVYPAGWVCVVQPDGEYTVARIEP